MRIIVAVLCALVAPLALRAQTPTPRSDPAFEAAATLAAMSGLTARPAWDAPVPATLDDALAESSTAKRKSTGKLLMIMGGSAVVAGAIVGGGGGAALIVAGILSGGYGFWLFQEK
ncbi:MAG TPA: hypothetical protein VLV16_06770 [Gemmatimonadales bacterium]|nr:hypothetical protein [Gemmatimonadales bacterium]